MEAYTTASPSAPAATTTATATYRAWIEY
jgi:hypothetical protein